MSQSGDYILGTNDAELQRLGLQNAVWRPRALDAWRRAGFQCGLTIIDFGAGPGFASFDLADAVRAEGRVLAWERNDRFLAHINAMKAARHLPQIETRQLDLAADELPAVAADGVWARWIFAFLPNPREALVRLAACIKPGGVAVIHEYFDYRSWRLFPRVASFESFVDDVMSSWREVGGEPDIGPDIDRWLVELGFEIFARQAIVDVIDNKSFVWAWPESFIENNIVRMLELGRMTAPAAEKALHEFHAASANTGTRMATPGVLELIARKRPTNKQPLANFESC
jgi:SAM-dependent methyltransferase